MADQPYQLFDALPAEQYEALKADIAKRGVLVPVEVDEAGTILDGHHRVQACTELGIADYPRVVRRDLDDTAKREHVLKLNLLRRHLGPVEWSDAFRKLAEMRGVRLGQQGKQKAKTATVAVLAAEVGVSERTARRRLREVAALEEHPDLMSAARRGEVEVKRAVTIARKRDAAEHARKRRQEFAAQRQSRGRQSVHYDQWASPRRWLVHYLAKAIAGRPLGDPHSDNLLKLQLDKLRWFLPTPPPPETEPYRGPLGPTTLRRIPREALADAPTASAIDKARADVEALRVEAERRYVELAKWICEQRQDIAAQLCAVAERLSDEPTVLVGRCHVDVDGGVSVTADVRLHGVAEWRSPHLAGDCRCEDALPIGCYYGGGG